MADVLLHEWKNRAFPPHDASAATARPLAMAALAAPLGALVYRRPSDLALDLADVRDTLRRARAFGIGRATAAGPGRAARLVLAAKLAMDELAEVTETLQATLGPDVDLVF